MAIPFRNGPWTWTGAFFLGSVTTVPCEELSISSNKVVENKWTLSVFNHKGHKIPYFRQSASLLHYYFFQLHDIVYT